MKITMYQVDAFTSHLFAGNPTAVCLTDEPLSEELMHKIAVENNLSETAFCYKAGSCYNIRWFTPEVEIDLCGHATLGTAYALFNDVEKGASKIVFKIKSGEEIPVTKDGQYLTLLFPVREGKPIAYRQDIAQALGGKPLEFYESRDIMVVYKTAKEVAELTPEVSAINSLGVFGIIATAPGEDNVDFVSRYFAPGCGVFEDPATGSSHCTLIPYWAKRLKKYTFLDKQLSKRIGTFRCELKDNQIYIKGEAVQLFKTSFEI
jgi:PhzF family phenazine biosynthesis protein